MKEKQISFSVKNHTFDNNWEPESVTGAQAAPGVTAVSLHPSNRWIITLINGNIATTCAQPGSFLELQYC